MTLVEQIVALKQAKNCIQQALDHLADLDIDVRWTYTGDVINSLEQSIYDLQQDSHKEAAE